MSGGGETSRAAPFRTPLKRARGLGSGKSGTGHFWTQRVTAIVLAPLVGWDGAGYRLGYGGGYYDRTLAAMTRKPRLVGLAFAAQELDSIPREPHDVPLDAVVTEAGVRHFGADA